MPPVKRGRGRGCGNFAPRYVNYDAESIFGRLNGNVPAWQPRPPLWQTDGLASYRQPYHQPHHHQPRYRNVANFRTVREVPKPSPPKPAIDKTLSDTIDSVKRKMQQRRVSETCPDRGDDAPRDSAPKKRIEHARSSPRPCPKRPDRGDERPPPETASSSPAPTEDRAGILRKKILQQLFKLNNLDLRKILSQPESSTKYNIALAGLIKDTRRSLARDLRRISEKSLAVHNISPDSDRGEEIVRDAFLGHLGSMLDTDASIELFNLDPQVIKELSRVLQQDLLDPCNEENIASVMHEEFDSKPLVEPCCPVDDASPPLNGVVSSSSKPKISVVKLSELMEKPKPEIAVESVDETASMCNGSTEVEPATVDILPDGSDTNSKSDTLCDSTNALDRKERVKLTKSQGTQYSAAGKANKSTQIYRSLVETKSKCTQISTKNNIKNTSSQPIDVSPAICSQNVKKFKDSAAQTDADALTKHKYVQCKIATKNEPAVDKPEELSVGGLLLAMKKIDDDMFAMMNEKCKLHKLIESKRKAAKKPASDKLEGSSKTVAKNDSKKAKVSKTNNDNSSSSTSHSKTSNRQPTDDGKETTVAKPDTFNLFETKCSKPEKTNLLTVKKIYSRNTDGEIKLHQNLSNVIEVPMEIDAPKQSGDSVDKTPHSKSVKSSDSRRSADRKVHKSKRKSDLVKTVQSLSKASASTRAETIEKCITQQCTVQIEKMKMPIDYINYKKVADAAALPNKKNAAPADVKDIDTFLDTFDPMLFDDDVFSGDFREAESAETIDDKSLIQICNRIEDDQERSVAKTESNNSILAIERVGRHVLAASINGNIYYYNGTNGNLIRAMKCSDNPVTSLCLGSLPNVVYAGSLDSCLYCFYYKTGNRIFHSINIGSPIQSMCYSWDKIYIGTRTGLVVHFSTKKNELIHGSSLQFTDTAILALRAIKEGSRKALLIASRSQDVIIKDASSGLLLRTFHGPNMTIYSILFYKGRVYCGTSSNDIQVFDFASGDLVCFHTGGKGAVCLQMYRGLLFAGCYDGVVYVFKLDCQQPIASIPGPGTMLLAMSIADGLIVGGCKDKSLSIWSIPKEVLQECDEN